MIIVQLHQTYSKSITTKYNQKSQNNLENKYLKWGRGHKGQKKTLLFLIVSNNHKASPYDNKFPILALNDTYQYLQIFY